MRAGRSLRPKGATGWAFNGVAAVALVAIAASTLGYTTQRTQLNDGGIWVTNDALSLFGRVDKPISQLDASFLPPSDVNPNGQLDILQDGSQVIAWDKQAAVLFPVDVTQAAVTKDDETPLPDAGFPAIGGGTLAVVEPGTGKVWVTRLATGNARANIGSVDPTTTPVVTVGKGAAMNVSSDGTVVVASPANGTLTTIRPTDTGFASPVTVKLSVTIVSAAITTVGDVPVILDTKGHELVVGGTSVPVTGDDLTLQQPGPSANTVLLASSTSLFEIPLGGGSPTTVFSRAAGAPAAPVRLGDCVHGAWAGTNGVYVRGCDSAPPQSVALPDRAPLGDPVFRINRGQILLNDATDGGVFDIDSTPRKIDHWETVQPHDSQTTDTTTQATTPLPQTMPPKAVADVLGARPGRTTVLHVLDNDSDPAGGSLAITAFGPVDDTSATLQGSPDAQTISVTLPPTATTDVHFSYTIENLAGIQASADVTVQIHPFDTPDGPPALLPTAKPPVLSVAAGGTISYPVLGDWRDPDGDPLVLLDATVDPSMGSATTTTDGHVVFRAGQTAGAAAITYTVSDGQGASPTGPLSVTVLSPDDTAAIPAVAQPDVVSAIVDKPVVIHPLDNDVPGADATNPQASLTLAGVVASPAGATVVTDIPTGALTFSASRPGIFQLTYGAAFGSAPVATGTIRVDVQPDPGTPLPPVAVPDTTIVHGTQAATVDVLANDYDPGGGVLAVTDAVVDGSPPIPLSVGVLEGRFVRISAQADPGSSSQPEVVDYTISNGNQTANGQVTVTLVPEDPRDPVAVDDAATVRAGDSVDVPVLDNDTDPNGEPLSLATDVPLALDPPDGGQASVTANVIRFIAPSTVTAQRTVDVSYTVQNASGRRATGTAHVTVVPLPDATNADQPPAPQVIEQRVAAGQTLTISVPSTGVDPDGDSVVLAGLTSTPTLGRILATTPSTIVYQAYPLSAGTDSFGYTVRDRFGLTGTSTIRIGVVAPGQSRAPVAVDDVLLAAPGTKVSVVVTANDIIDPDGFYLVQPLETTNKPVPAGASLGDGNTVTVTAPPAGQVVAVLYGLSDGIHPPSVAAVRVQGVTGYDIPPVAHDDDATPKPGATTVTVDALANDTDADGPNSALSLVDTHDPRVTVQGRELVITVQPYAQAVPYEIEDGGQKTAVGVVHVAPGGTALGPTLKPGVVIDVPAGGTKTVKLSDLVDDTKPVRLTTTDRITASPSPGLKIVSSDDTTLVLTADPGYAGPAAIGFEVTDGTSLTDPDGRTAVLTVPAQVGADAPVLRCPPGPPLQVVEGGAPLVVDIDAYCHVWVQDASKLAGTTLTEAWMPTLAGVTLTPSMNGHTVTLTPTRDAHPGDSGELALSSAGAQTSTFPVTVIATPPPTLRPITLDGVRAGSATTVNVAPYLSSPLADPAPTLVSVVAQGATGTSATTSGTSVTITPGKDAKGTLVFTVVAADVAGRPDRQATSSLTVHVLGHPDAPAYARIDKVSTHTAVISFPTPANNGAPIDTFRVTDSTGRQTSCAASPCTLTGLTNGTPLTVTVAAHNVVGFSDETASSNAATPDQVPARTTMNAPVPADMKITVSWAAAQVDGSPVDGYRLTVSPAPSSGVGTQDVAAGTTTVVVNGLDNHTTYSFTVKAHNAAGYADASDAVKAESFGKPATVGKPTTSFTNSANNHDRDITVSWAAPDGNGRAITGYTVTQYKDGAATGSMQTASTSQVFGPLANDGSSYTYSVVAKNAGGLSSEASAKSTAVTATAKPDTVGKVTATDHANGQTAGYDRALHVAFTWPAANGKSITSASYRLSSGGTGSLKPPAAGETSTEQAIGGLTNGQSYSVAVTVCNESSCSTESAGSNSVMPYGPVPTPTAKAVASGTSITYSWAGSTNGRTVTYYVNIDGAGFSARGTSGSSVTKDEGYSAKGTIAVYAMDAAGNTSAQASASDTTDPKPVPPPPTTPPAANNPSITIEYGAATADCSGCYRINMHFHNFPVDNNPYSFTCNNTGNTYQMPSVTSPDETITGSDAPGHQNCYGQKSDHFSVTVRGYTSNKT